MPLSRLYSAVIPGVAELCRPGQGRPPSGRAARRIVASKPIIDPDQVRSLGMRDQPGAVPTVFGIDRKTVAKMMAFSVPPGYRRSGPPRRPKLEAFTGIIDRILEG